LLKNQVNGKDVSGFVLALSDLLATLNLVLIAFLTAVEGSQGTSKNYFFRHL
jgi:hypothetical protein